MVRKWKYGEWRSMQTERELIELAKTQTLETIAARRGRSISSDFSSVVPQCDAGIQLNERVTLSRLTKAMA